MSHFRIAPPVGGLGRGWMSRCGSSVLSVLLVAMPLDAAHAWQPGKDGSRAVAANTGYASLPEVRITTLAASASAGA